MENIFGFEKNYPSQKNGKCQACQKMIKDEKNHFLKNPLCQTWAEKTQNCPIAKYLEHKYNNQPEINEENDFKCLACKKGFSNLGNLNKHLNNHLVCKKINKYKELEKINDYLS